MDGPSENTRYLASFLAESYNEFVIPEEFHSEAYIDADKLAQVIDRYYKELT